MAPLKNIIDLVIEILEKKGSASISEMAHATNYNSEKLENIFKVFEKANLVEISYPIIHSSNIKLLKKLETHIQTEPAGEIIDEYEINVDGVHIYVKQIKDTNKITYFTKPPEISAYTELFLETLRDEIAENIDFDISELTDPEKNQEIKNKFTAVAKSTLEKYIKTNNEELEMLCGIILHKMYGLGDIEYILADSRIEEITINSSKFPINIYHRKYGWMQTNIKIENEELVANYSEQIGRKIGREINALNPILDAHLSNGNRVNSTLKPVSSSGNTITIRLFATRPWTIVDMVGELHTMDYEMAALLWIAMQYEMNVLVAGGTASGKTSALNALCSFIPTYHRIISIEDVREIMLPEYMRWNWVPLVTKNPNPEGQGKISMLDLVENSLRMRPDRIIVGEIRREEEAEVLFEAMHTGHSVYSTIHANNSRQVVRRLTEKPIQIPPLEIEAIDLLVVQFRDRKTNRRRTYEISEIDSGIGSESLSINTIYRWSPRDDTFDKTSKPTKIYRQLNLHTGLTEAEIESEIEKRCEVLKWMVENKINNLDDVGKIINDYYANPEKILQKIRKDSGVMKMEHVKKRKQ